MSKPTPQHPKKCKRKTAFKRIMSFSNAIPKKQLVLYIKNRQLHSEETQPPPSKPPKPNYPQKDCPYTPKVV